MSPSELLAETTTLLEFIWLVGSAAEVASRREPTSWPEMARCFEEAAEVSPLDLTRLWEELRAHFPELCERAPSDAVFEEVVLAFRLEPLRPELRAMLETFPPEQMSWWETETGDIESVHRCRRALTGIKGLLRRHGCDRRWATIGRLYAAGKVSASDIADLLGDSVPDTLQFLEEHGYTRPLTNVALDEQERRSRLARIEADRRRRDGLLASDDEMTRRSVIASQRIEGIDARRHLD